MKLFLIFLETAIIIFLFLYFNKRIDEQNRQIMELKDIVHKTQVKGASDTNEIRFKYYNLQRILDTKQPPKE